MKTEETIREDGLHIITVRVPSKKVHMELNVRVGSAYDPHDKLGLYHFFEHMAFKGTTERSLDAVVSFRQRNLLSWNASTDKLITSYHGEAVWKKMPQLCDIITDVGFNSIFPSEELEREKEVVLNEIARDQDNDHLVAYRALWNQLWRENPSREFGVGSPEGVQVVSRDDLVSAQKRWYMPSNSLIIAVGKLNHAEFVDEINKQVPLNPNLAPPLQQWSDEADEVPAKRETVIELSGRKKTIVLVGSKVPFYVEQKMQLKARFFEFMMCRGTTSRLWRELREKRGLLYTVSGGVHESFSLGHYFYVAIETLPARVEEVKKRALDLLMEPLVGSELFSQTQEWLGDHFSLGDDQLPDWADLVFRAIVCKKPLRSVERNFQRALRIAASMTLEEVECMRQYVIRPDHLVTVVMQPC